ncbi:hypothetical protein ABT060_38515, partial [Streptomyces sp. NPDC002722]
EFAQVEHGGQDSVGDGQLVLGAGAKDKLTIANSSPRWRAARRSCSCARPPASTAGPTTGL